MGSEVKLMRSDPSRGHLQKLAAWRSEIDQEEEGQSNAGCLVLNQLERKSVFIRSWKAKNRFGGGERVVRWTGGVGKIKGEGRGGLR